MAHRLIIKAIEFCRLYEANRALAFIPKLREGSFRLSVQAKTLSLSNNMLL